MKKLVALMLTLALLLTGCVSAFAETTGTSMAVCLSSEPDTLDPALNSSVDGATMIAHMFSGLATWAQKDDGTLEIVADSATELTAPV